MNANMIIAVCYYVVLIVQFWVMWKEQKPKENEIFAVTVPDAVMENPEMVQLRKRYGTGLAGAGIVSVVLPLSLFLTEWATVQALLWMVSFILMAVLTCLPYWMANRSLKRMKGEHSYMDQAPGMEEVENLWKWGMFYYNPDDHRLMVGKKVGVGTCINHGRARGKVLSGLSWVAIVAVLVLGIHLIRMQSTPLFLAFEDGVLKAGQTRTNYTLDADMMQMAMLLDELPKEERILGTGLMNVERGIYNVSGFGNCKLNLNPQNHAFIVIYAEDGCYIFSADTDKKTKEVYEQLKNEL